MSKHAIRTLLRLAGAGLVLAALTANASAAPSAGGLASLPAEMRAWYTGAGVPTGTSPYLGFKPKDGPPWTIGYASTYSGNTWRASALSEVKKQFEKYKRAGLVDKLIVTENQFNVAQTVQQLKQLRDKGVDGILTIAPSSTGINQAIADAFKAKIPVVNFASPVTSSKAINTGANYPASGRLQAELLTKELGGKGTIVYVTGIPGFAASEQLKEGALAYYKTQPGIKVLAEVAGLWTNAVAKAELLKVLATNPQKIDAVHNQTGMAAGIIEGLDQSGRDGVRVSIADDVAGGVYWKQNRALASIGTSVVPARGEARLAFDTLMRTLEGQGPKVASIIHAPSRITFGGLAKLLPAGATTASTDWFETIGETFYRDSVPKFFARPTDPLKFKK